jgi:hypothetical protein
VRGLPVVVRVIVRVIAAPARPEDHQSGRRLSAPRAGPYREECS